MVLFRLALLRASFTTRRRSRRVAIAPSRVTHNDGAANRKHHIQHIQLLRAAHPTAVLGIRLVKHGLELAPVQDGDLGVGVLEVQLRQPPPERFVRERGRVDGRLRVQAEEGISHRRAAAAGPRFIRADAGLVRARLLV